MSNLITKTGQAISNAVLFCIGLAMAGLGLLVAGFLALFGLMAVGLALLASPFVASAIEQPEKDAPADTAAAA